MDKADKAFILYVIKNKLFGFDWSFYGGNIEPVPEKQYDKFLNRVKETGIDWDKTRPFFEDTESVFVSTFDDVSFTSVLSTTVHLKDKSKYKVICTIETMSNLFKHLLESHSELRNVEL